MTELRKICEQLGCAYEENPLLAPYTSFKIGGSCPLLIKPSSTDALARLIGTFAAKNQPYRILGRGTNLLISDDGVAEPVLLFSGNLGEIKVQDSEITASAGASLMSVCKAALEQSLSGVEFAFGIPGTVGGALYMNAGAYGGEMKDVVVSCRCITPSGGLQTVFAEKMQLSYRHSIFSEKSLVIAEVKMKLAVAERAEISARMTDFMQRRKDKQPLEVPSAGSTFKRPDGDFAGRLIEAAGLRGFRHGGAAVSQKHCGFVVNLGGATCKDVCELIEIVQEKVFAASGVMLEREVIIWE